MGFNECDNCNAPIIWDKLKRQQLNTRLPLNRDGTIHMCGRGGGNGSQPQQQQQTQQQRPTNPIQNVVMTDQEKRNKDIKDAQEERRQQHREYIRNLQWNTKMLAYMAEHTGGGIAQEILDSIGFREYREDQHAD